MSALTTKLQKFVQNIKFFIKPDKNPAVYFLHVQRTGGSTFCKVASRNIKLFAHHQVGIPVKILDGSRRLQAKKIVDPVTGAECLQRNYRQIKFWKWSKRKQIEFFAQHPGYFIANETGGSGRNVGPSLGKHMLPKRHVRYVTILRHPVDIIISHYHHTNLYRKQHHLKPLPPMEEYFLQNVNIKKRHNRLVRSFSSDPNNISLKEAKQRLLKFDAVLFFDSYHEDMNVLKRKFGWRYIDIDASRTGTQSNTSKVVNDSSEIVAWLKENNKLDLEFYEFAKTVKDKINK